MNKKTNMENKNSREGLYSFSQSNTKRFIADHLDKIVWVCILFLVVFTIVTVGYLCLYGIIFLLFLCAICYFFGRIQKKFAYKIIVDFNSREVRLHLHRNESIIAADFKDIKSIRVNGYIIFALKEGKLFYNDLQDNYLFECLNRVKKIDWGPLCGIWGPSKNVRDSISGNIQDNC